MTEPTLVSPTLLIALLRFAHALTQYSIPDTPPTIHLVPRSVLQEKARELCNGRCRVFGWYALQAHDVPPSHRGFYPFAAIG